MPNPGLVLDNPVLRIDKGRISPPSEDEQEPRGIHDEHIPWGYGRDRLTAMVVDPNRLYLYWELTDPSLDKARHALGPAGKDAWVNVRIYDVTGLIFDGTNAHSYFDIKVDRSDRQWFVHIGKPSSSHVAEIGLKSIEGYFVKIVRAGRADFPRFEPSSDGTVEWLTVRTATGPVDGPSSGWSNGAGGSPGGHGGPAAGGAPAGGTLAGPQGVGAAGAGDGHVELSEWSWTGWEELFQTTWQELFQLHWRDGRPSFDWSGPTLRSTWEAGPFPVPVEAPRVTTEVHQGPVTLVPVPGGKTRVIYGPWEVVVRGIEGHAEKRVIARWEMEASWIVEMGVERVVSVLAPSHTAEHGARNGGKSYRPGGASEIRFGASERRWLSASDLRLRGASEEFLLGASERRFRGSSETIMGSERRLLGASERLWLGGSEQIHLGASESRLDGSGEVSFRDFSSLGRGT